VATALIALGALHNWRRQDKAKREAEFLDHLIEAMHSYIVEMHSPIELLRMARIGMASHVATWEEGDSAEKVARGAIAYISKHGAEHGKRLAASLKIVEPSVVRLRSLASKGQVFKFRNYAHCQNAVSLLTWHVDRLWSFVTIIDTPTWNWENPEVRSLLDKVMKIEADDIRESIGQNDVAAIEWARLTYERIYG